MDTEAMIIDIDDQELSKIVTEVFDATSYAVEKVSASAASPGSVDDFFTVSLCYKDSRYPNEINSTFTFKKQAEDDLDVPGVVSSELEKLGDNVHPKAYDCVIDAVQESCEKLLQQVKCVGRKSLAMIVNVYMDVSALDDVGDDMGYYGVCDDMDDDGDEIHYGETVNDNEVYYGETVDDYNDGDEMDFGETLVYDDDDDEFYDDYDGVDFEEEEETMSVKTTVSSVDVKEFMSKSGSVKFISGDQMSTGVLSQSCSICLEEFEKCEDNCGESKQQEDDDGVAVLPCGHVLHTDCLVPWITMGGKDTCPLCRFKLNIPC